MVNPWILLVWAISLVAAGTISGVWQNKVGHTQERVVWQSKNIIELSADNKAVFDTEEKYRAAESDHAANLAAIQADYQRKGQDANKKTDTLIAAARAGTFRLRDPSATVAKPSDRDNLPQSSPGARGCDDKTGTGLLGKADTVFLIGEASRADQIVRQLSACQSVIAADRK